MEFLKKMLLIFGLFVVMVAGAPLADAQTTTEETQSTGEEAGSRAGELIVDGLADQARECFEDVVEKGRREAALAVVEDVLRLTGPAGSLVGGAVTGRGLIGCTINETVKHQLSNFWEDPIGKFTKAILEGNTEAITTVMTFWMEFSTTSVDVSANTQGVKNIVMGVSGLALIASFMIGGWRIASSRRGGMQEGVSDLNENMLRWMVFSIAVPAMMPGALLASDSLADAIMNQFADPNAVINLGTVGESHFGPIVTLILALIVLAGSVVQMLALVTRVLLAPIAAGLTPLFAALSFSDMGKQGLNHLVSFLIAAIAFKPVSAVLYAVVLWNVSGTEEIGGTQVVINALMVGLAGFSAPVLVRAIVPAVAQAGGGGAAPMLAGATGALAGGSAMMGAAMRGAGKAVNSAAGSGGSSGSSVGQSSGSSSQSMSAAGTGVKGSGSGGGGQTRSSGSNGPQGASTGKRAMTAVRSVGRAGARGAGRTLGVTGAAASSVGAGARQLGGAAAGVQRILDDSIGVPGSYAGQAHR